MTQLGPKKDRTNPVELIVAIVLGLLAIGCFLLQITTTSEKSTRLEAALFSMLQFLLTVGFAWFTTRAISRTEFERSLKRFAIGAYRRIADIERINNRLRASVREIASVSTDQDRGDLAMIEDIVEDAGHVIRSSIDDWADVIGEELVALESMRRLEREKNELKASSEITHDKPKQTDAIQNLEAQIDALRTKIPTNLLVISRKDEHYHEVMAAAWLARKHAEQGGFKFRVVAGGDYSDEPDPKKLKLDQELFTRKTKLGALDALDSSGSLLGRVLNPLPYDYDTSVKILEQCYGTSELALKYEKTIKEYERRKGRYIHYQVSVLTPPQENQKRRVVITE